MQSKVSELLLAAVISGIATYFYQRYVPPNTAEPKVYLQGPFKDLSSNKYLSIVTVMNDSHLIATNVIVRIRYDNPGLWLFDFSLQTSGDEPPSVLRKDDELFIKFDRIVPDAYLNVVLFQKYPSVNKQDIDVSSDGGQLTTTSYFAWPKTQ